ncbi:MAG: STAS/SEC14 domain-containing protein [Chloroflexia bacterium]|nr:STAS/SEC14 domain-containing protein [Chloroflexia bacterium]
MAGYSVINYKGKEIAYIDYRGLKLEQMLQTLNNAVETAIKRSQEGHPPRPLLINISDAYAVPEFMEKSKEAGKKTRHLTSKSAIVGITGAKKILLQAYNLFTRINTKVFDDEESAKEWLIME